MTESDEFAKSFFIEYLAYLSNLVHNKNKSKDVIFLESKKNKLK